MFTEMTGRALAFKLASQGLNVVLVSLDDDHLKDTMKQLKNQFPKLEFRSVAVTFSPGVDYLKQIDEATKDITIQCIFNNAGFIVTGFVDQTALPKLLSNVECNATAAFAIAHLFLQRLVSNKQRGCIVRGRIHTYAVCGILCSDEGVRFSVGMLPSYRGAIVGNRCVRCSSLSCGE